MVAMATRPSGRRSRGASQTQITTVVLGCVDGFDKYNGAGEARECGKGRRGLVAAKGNALEALQFSHCLLNARPQLVEHLGEEAPALLRVRLARDDRRDSACQGCRSVGAAVISLISDRHPRRDVRTEVKGSFELCGVANLAAGQVEIERIAVDIGLEMDFRREAAA